VSLDEVHDLRAKIEDVDRRLIRIEERQVTLYKMIETALASFGDLANRVTALEHLKTKMLLVAGAVGAIVSLAWDALKARFSGG
jgi:hypothetical protein